MATKNWRDIILLLVGAILGVIIGVMLSPYLQEKGFQYAITGKPMVQAEIQSVFWENISISGNMKDLNQDILIINHRPNPPLILFFKTLDKNFNGSYETFPNLDYPRLGRCNCTENWLTITNIGKTNAENVVLEFDINSSILEWGYKDPDVEILSSSDGYAKNMFYIKIAKLEASERKRISFFTNQRAPIPIKSCEASDSVKYCRTILSEQLVSDISSIVYNDTLSINFIGNSHPLYIDTFGEYNFMYKYNLATGKGDYLFGEVTHVN